MWKLRYRNKNTPWIEFYFRNCPKKVAVQAKNDMIHLWDQVELTRVEGSQSRNPYKRRVFTPRKTTEYSFDE